MQIYVFFVVCTIGWHLCYRIIQVKQKNPFCIISNLENNTERTTTFMLNVYYIGNDKPMVRLLLAWLSGINCLLSLPKKRSVPMVKLQRFPCKLATKPPVTPVLVKPILKAASNHFVGAMLAENTPWWYE